jgi:hypothetical protein
MKPAQKRDDETIGGYQSVTHLPLISTKADAE